MLISIHLYLGHYKTSIIYYSLFNKIDRCFILRYLLILMVTFYNIFFLFLIVNHFLYYLLNLNSFILLTIVLLFLHKAIDQLVWLSFRFLIYHLMNFYILLWALHFIYNYLMSIETSDYLPDQNYLNSDLLPCSDT